MTTPTTSPAFERVPRGVGRYLLPHERAAITVRLHPAVLILPVLITLAGLAGAGTLSGARIASDEQLIAWTAFLLLLMRLAFKIYSWLEDYYVVTDIRILAVTGVGTRDVVMIPLARVGDLRLRRTSMGRFLGYGQFIIEPVGQAQGLRVMNYLPYPDQLYLEVCNLLFPGSSEEQF
ncbi:MAG TPA: PH domain-containing protein [Trebonia sp.]|jgi:uncharacterized membrane protein|nr:PH domain-containing protein [Trebonia sp.]